MFPEPAAAASLDDLYGAPRARVAGRPWVGVCMVASLDGGVVVDGRSKDLGSEHDAAVFARLRQAADVIIVGAATVRQEGYAAPRKHGQRLGIVTGSGVVDTSTDLFASGAGFLVMAEDGPSVDPSIDVVRAGRDQIDLPLAVRRLDEVSNAPTFVQAEGGPRLNGALLDADCVDELNLSVSPMLTGGSGPRLTSGAEPALQRFTLAHLVVDDDSFAFTRWVRRRDADAPARRE